MCSAFAARPSRASRAFPTPGSNGARSGSCSLPSTSKAAATSSSSAPWRGPTSPTSNSISAPSEISRSFSALGLGATIMSCRASCVFSRARAIACAARARLRRNCWPGAGTIGAKAPSPEDRADIDLGFRVVAALGRLDIGQAAVVSKGHVLAVEAAEGTDAMLARCAELRQASASRRRGLSGVLVKSPKPGQEERVDMPTIGPGTVEKAARAGLAGIAVAAGKLLIADRAATIAAADMRGAVLVRPDGRPRR